MTLAPLPPLGDKGVYSIGESVRRGQNRPVLDILPGLAGKGRMDDRRFAVADGVAEYAVFVGHMLEVPVIEEEIQRDLVSS